MQKKMKLQQVLIIVLALVISLLLVTLLAGRNDTTTILVTASDKVDTNKKLDEQIQYFEEKKILKSDLEVFEGTAVTNTAQLKGKYLRFKPTKGEPVLLSNLSAHKAAGEFAAEMTKYHTVFRITDGKAALPPEVQPGDKIDILLIIQPKQKDESLSAGPIMTSVTVKSMDEKDVYVYVTQAEAARLTLGQEIGKFVLQLPGQKKDSVKCSSVKKNSKDDVSCYNNSDKPSTITEDELREYILNNSAIGQVANSTDLQQLTDENNTDNSSSKETTSDVPAE